MKATVVRYQAKPERADENQRLIEAVFAELDEREPEGFTYKVFRLEDGVSFIHVVIEHDVDEPDSLQAVPAFQAFVADIADRCDVPPGGDGSNHRRRLPLIRMRFPVATTPGPLSSAMTLRGHRRHTRSGRASPRHRQRST